MNLLQKHILLIFSVLINVLQIDAQDLYQRKFALEELREDFEILQNALQEGHPNLYRYAPPEELDLAFREAFDQLDSEMSELEYYNFIKPLIAQIQDGNTALMLSDYGDTFLKDRARFFPFDVKIIDQKTFVNFNYSEAKHIQIGAEILRINGHSAAEILDKMIRRAASDAKIKSAIFWRLEQEGYAFELLSIYGEDKQFEIEFKNPQDTEIQKVMVMAVSYRKKITDFLEANEKQIIDAENPFKFQIWADQKTALLDVDVLGDFFSGNPSFYKFIKKSFKEIQKQKIEHLILDLRNNAAGEELYGAYLYSFLTDTTFKLFNCQYINQKKYNFASFTDAGSSLNREFVAIKSTETDSGNYIISLNGLDEKQFPARENFKGNLYILTNGGTFGMASYITGLLQQNRTAPTFVIGSETGSSIRGGTGGRLPYLTLPNSNLILTLPLVRYDLEIIKNQDEKRGVLPDYEVEYEAQEIVQIQDKVLDFTKKLIEKQLSKSHK